MKKSKCKKKCDWHETGMARYSCPLEFEEKCESCKRTRWKVDKEGIPTIELKEGSKEWNEFRRKYHVGN